jgi:hypothetical protein
MTLYGCGGSNINLSGSTDCTECITERLAEDKQKPVLFFHNSIPGLHDCGPSQMHVSQHYTDLLARAVANSQLEHSLALMATHIGRRANQGDSLTRFGGPLKGRSYEILFSTWSVMIMGSNQKPVLVVSFADPGSGAFLTPGSGIRFLDELPGSYF